MGKKRITRTVERKVTDIRIEPHTSVLVVHAIDEYGPGKAVIGHWDLSELPEKLPDAVQRAIDTIIDHANAWADEQT